MALTHISDSVIVISSVPSACVFISSASMKVEGDISMDCRSTGKVENCLAPARRSPSCTYLLGLLTEQLGGVCWAEPELEPERRYCYTWLKPEVFVEKVAMAGSLVAAVVAARSLNECSKTVGASFLPNRNIIIFRLLKSNNI